VDELVVDEDAVEIENRGGKHVEPALSTNAADQAGLSPGQGLGSLFS
jgi:hypothetical protein